MSIFSIPESDRQDANEQDSRRGGRDIKTVSALSSPDGNGSTRFRATIPADFARSMNLEAGDTLVMERREGGIFIEDPHE